MKNPESIDEFLAFRIYHLGKMAAQGVGIMLKREQGITRRDWKIIAFVVRHPNMSLSELAEAAQLETELASRGVAKLVEAGIIVKSRLPTNKRLLVLSLTPAGRDLYEQTYQATKRFNAALAECLSDKEAELLDHLLKKLGERAEQLTQRELQKSGSN
ncbi:MarR family winged helix-turn-helix transcriptional regulator [Rhodopseudomonas sp. B29]|uniref:MarR family winged helix-turn-helix transcriptional regulator n=1 Tax=Rhodopseudomonas sp. B29 TaxID=95607 RepID=UPI0003461E23|nr:MarR family transcriptional regulator [Rhodopseudomonas sp. B29]